MRQFVSIFPIHAPTCHPDHYPNFLFMKHRKQAPSLQRLPPNASRFYWLAVKFWSDQCSCCDMNVTI